MRRTVPVLAANANAIARALRARAGRVLAVVLVSGASAAAAVGNGTSPPDQAPALAPPAPGVGPGPAAPAASAPVSTQDLRAWLQRVREAASRANYAGTLVNWAGPTVTSMHLVHYADARGVELEKVEAMDGEARTMLRVGEQVRTVWPARRLAVNEPRDPRAAFPSLVSGTDTHVPDYYELLPMRPQRVAGRDADRVLLRARDPQRFDQMVWTDHATGLLLRVDVQASNRTLESTAFSDIAIGVRPQPEQVLDDLKRSQAFRAVPSSLERTQLEAEGWHLKGALPPGFQVLGCLRRMMPAGGGDAAADTRVVHVIFTDGLTYVSVFIEPWQPQRHPGAGLSVLGATHTMTRRAGDDWLTAVGDVPPTTLEQFLLQVERARR